MYSNQSKTNVTVGPQYQGLLGLVLFSMVTTAPCCVFLFINATMLFTLRSKSVFCETSRYVLLYNLVLADTINLLVSQILYILAACRIMMTYPVCGFLSMLASVTTVISPLTLVVMSLERYVTVCCPFRHTTIVTIRNTGLAIILVWTFSSLNVLVQALVMFYFSFRHLQSLQMEVFCGKESIFLDPLSELYDKYFTYALFLSACVAVISSYMGVMVAARSASADKASAQKACKTLLLHLVQLGLSLSSIIHNTLLSFISQNLDRIVIVRIQIIMYICLIILPRCLSSLVYGLRDQMIRPVLMNNLSCQRKCFNPQHL